MMIWHANISQAKTAWRYAILLSVVLGTLLFMMTRQPFGQVLAYHDFADKRAFLGVPNFLDVATNIAYLAVGLFGVWSCFRSTAPGYRIGWLTLFIGVSLIGFGSAYYHLDPKNSTLVWDRLPMAIAFMALFSFFLSQHINARLGGWLLWPLLAIGIFSVLYWIYTENQGVGDLRLYALVQFLPALLIPLIIILFPSNRYQKKYIWYLISLYALAKVAEHYDDEIMNVVSISGHTLKHIFAAFSGIAFMKLILSWHVGGTTAR